MEKTRPIKQFRLGNIRAAVWPIQKDQKTNGVTIERHYQQGTEWKTTSRYNPSDLPVVAFLALVGCWWTLLRGDATEDHDQS